MVSTWKNQFGTRPQLENWSQLGLTLISTESHIGLNVDLNVVLNVDLNVLLDVVLDLVLNLVVRSLTVVSK